MENDRPKCPNRLTDRERQRRERIERLLGTDLRQYVKRGSELQFDYAEATRIAKST